MIRPTGLLRDLRLVARGLCRTPGFTLTVILSLAAGLGAATAIFSLVQAVVLRPLPYRDPSRLVMIWETHHGKGLGREPISPVNLLDYRGLRHVFSDATAWWEPVASLNDPGLEATRVAAIEAASNFFSVLGVRAALGSTFAEEGGLHRRGAAEVVISDRLWRSRYGADPAIVGSTIRLDYQAHTVVGVMPPGFTFPGETDSPRSGSCWPWRA